MRLYLYPPCGYTPTHHAACVHTHHAARVHTHRGAWPRYTHRGAWLRYIHRGTRVIHTHRGTRVIHTHRGARMRDTHRGARMRDTHRGTREIPTVVPERYPPWCGERRIPTMVREKGIPTMVREGGVPTIPPRTLRCTNSSSFLSHPGYTSPRSWAGSPRWSVVHRCSSGWEEALGSRLRLITEERPSLEPRPLRVWEKLCPSAQSYSGFLGIKHERLDSDRVNPIVNQ